MKKLSPNRCGAAGVYFVAAELSRRRCTAAITIRNAKGIDILASNERSSKSVGIQVKTSQGTKKNWILNKAAEDYFADDLFYVFVNLKDEVSRPDYYIVPSKVVAEYVKKGHAEWLGIPGKKGQPHKDNPVRKFRDAEGKYLERWDLLGL